MGWVRLIILLAAVYLVYRLVWGRRSSTDSNPQVGSEGALRRCCRCGTLVPLEGVLSRDDRVYCGRPCADEDV